MPRNTGTAVQELEIGPFSGGINTYSDAAQIADDELVDCINFDLSLDGSLKSRPPWSLMKAIQGTNATQVDSFQLVIGTGTFEGFRYVIVTSSHVAGAAATYIYYVDGPNAGTLAKITDGYHTKAHRYVNDVYLVPDNTSPGRGAKYNLTTGVVTIFANMPTGYASIIYKDRLWISGRATAPDNESRLYFSELIDFGNYPGTNFFDINPGDGDSVNELIVYQDNIVIFKDNSTWVLAYDTGPAQAVLQVINTDIGAMGPFCVDVYENSVFVLKYNQLYEMSNYDFVRVSVKIPFDYDTAFPEAPYNPAGQSFKYPFWCRIVGDRAVVRFYNRLYIYHLRLRGWTRWNSLDPNINYIGPITRLDNTNTGMKRGFDTYVAGTTLARNVDVNGVGAAGARNMYFKLFKFEDQYEGTNRENGNITPLIPGIDIQLYVLSKQFDIGLSHRFKRLMHWGIDCYTGRRVTGGLFPFSVAYQVTWEQLETYFWHDLKTWQRPIAAFPPVSQESPPGAAINTRFLRFPKSLRFRLLQFEISMVTVGNTSDGPAYLYSITAFISGKQLVPKGVN